MPSSSAAVRRQTKRQNPWITWNHARFRLWKVMNPLTHDHRALDVFDTIYEMEDGLMKKMEHSQLENST